MERFIDYFEANFEAVFELLRSCVGDSVLTVQHVIGGAVGQFKMSFEVQWRGPKKFRMSFEVQWGDSRLTMRVAR